MNRYHAGIGCRRGVDAKALYELLERTLRRNGLRVDQIASIASIDARRHEPGLLELASLLNVPLRFFSAQQLAPFEHCARETSAVVQRATGVAAVAETAALAACGDGGELLGRKLKSVAATCALARVSLPEKADANAIPLSGGRP
jgi:cobalt-precorrin 5A hydrolase